MKGRFKEALKTVGFLLLLSNGVFVVFLILGIIVANVFYDGVREDALTKIVISSELTILFLVLLRGVLDLIGEGNGKEGNGKE